jgi:hypothetical protein
MIFGLILLSAAEVAAAGEGHVYKFLSARKLSAGGRDHLVVVVQPPAGGPSIRLVVPNDDQDRYSPKKQDADILNGMQAGQFVQAQTEKKDAMITIVSIAAWSPRPGEETPHGYVYLTSNPSGKNPADLEIALTKFGEGVNLIVPGEPGPDGVPAPNQMIAAELKQVQQGDVVWADIPPGKTQTLAAIAPWSEPRHGKLMRVSPADVDGERGFAAEIATEAKPVTALIPLTLQSGRHAADPRLLAEARKAGNGTEVLFRVREDGEKTWLLEIERPPKQPPPVAQRPNNSTPPAGIPVRSTGGAGSVPGVGGGIPGGF